MPKGGARTRSGTPPDPDALARNRDGAEWVKLPAKGRQGPTPPWPTQMGTISADEKKVWERLWKTPQALVWEADGVHDTVALYVRTLCEASLEGSPTTLRVLVRQQQDALLLSIPALHHAKFVIDKKLDGATPGIVDHGATGTTGAAVRTSGGSARDRFTVVPTTDDEDADLP
jgi:hypothetical protein